MLRVLYTLLLYLATPVVLLRLRWRARSAAAYQQRWGERFALTGFRFKQPSIWLHAVSVGETLAALDMIAALKSRYPQHRLLITTTTPTGSERVRQALGDSVDHVYLPYDLPDCWWRFFRHGTPQLLIVMETELWPNLLAACKKRAIPVLLANARLSEKSAAGYQRFSALTRPMLSNLTLIAAQQDSDGERFANLGAAKVEVTGNIKFDLQLGSEIKQRAQQIRQQWSVGGACLWLAASTHQGEDEMVLAAFKLARVTCPTLRLLLVPRHPERFVRVAAMCTQAGWRTANRSTFMDGDFDVMVGDTMGELLMLYGVCDFTFVGGSLVPTGGHNMIEPAAWSKPVLTGPHLHNFAEVARLMTAAGAMAVVDDSAALAQQVAALATNAELVERMGAAGFEVAETNRGALQRLLGHIDQLL